MRQSMKKSGSGKASTGVKDMGSLFHGAKRYADGGEVEAQEAADKAAGLKASAGEKGGMFQRLFEGNIDDPNSVAYAKYGAGRGKRERTPDNVSGDEVRLKRAEKADDRDDGSAVYEAPRQPAQADARKAEPADYGNSAASVAPPAPRRMAQTAATQSEVRRSDNAIEKARKKSPMEKVREALGRPEPEVAPVVRKRRRPAGKTGSLSRRRDAE
jgi:hypothetical protein